jgi:hypothetical protein
MDASSQTSDYEKGLNASCTIRPVLSVVASHLEMVPTNESHLLASCVRVSASLHTAFVLDALEQAIYDRGGDAPTA